MSARICIVTAGHLSTSPRMLKAADALAAAGYGVRVVSARFMDWATATDDEVRRSRGDAWNWTTVDYGRKEARLGHLRTGLRVRAMRSVARLLGPSRCPVGLAARAWSRVQPELVRAVLREPADLLYGGGAGLSAVAEAGQRAGVSYAIDLEDFHTAEQDLSPAADLAHALAERIERDALPRATFLTAAGVAIADAYAHKYGVRAIPINNTFPLPAKPPDLAARSGEGLRFYWFSQTIGPGRGLEDVIRGVGVAGICGELHLRGRPVPDYFDGLSRLARDAAPRLKVVQHEPAPPDAMVELCRGYDIGLSVEQGRVVSRALCLTNKAFTYMLAGLAVIFTDTPGQRRLACDLGEGALLYRPGDITALGHSLQSWANDPRCLWRARAAAWQAAQRRWHWEHPEEQGALVRACAAALGHEVPCAS